jgi:hypothetical protein
MTEKNILEISGKLSADPDLTERKFMIKDVTDAPHPFSFPAELDPVMKKWKAGYYLTVTYDSETRMAKNVTYWQEGKEEWAKAHQNQGGSKGKSRNERAIILQCCLKVAADVWISDSDKTLKYEDVMVKITGEAIKAAGEIFKAAGV